MHRAIDIIDVDAFLTENGAHGTHGARPIAIQEEDRLQSAAHRGAWISGLLDMIVSVGRTLAELVAVLLGHLGAAAELVEQLGDAGRQLRRRAVVLVGHLAHDGGVVDENIGGDDLRLYDSPGHHQDFLKCIRTRNRPVCDVAIGHRATCISHLGNISFRLGRPLEYDPGAETFPNDEAAIRMCAKPMRAPWCL